MKLISQHLKPIGVALIVITLFIGCAGHKKAKCNDCPKWSKAEIHRTASTLG